MSHYTMYVIETFRNPCEPSALGHHCHKAKRNCTMKTIFMLALAATIFMLVLAAVVSSPAS